MSFLNSFDSICSSNKYAVNSSLLDLDRQASGKCPNCVSQIQIVVLVTYVIQIREIFNIKL